MAVESLSVSDVFVGYVSMRRAQTSVCGLIIFESIGVCCMNATEFSVGQQGTKTLTARPLDHQTARPP